LAPSLTNAMYLSGRDIDDEDADDEMNEVVDR
jgi:hypothetical protein